MTSGEHALRIRLSRRPGDSDNHGGVDVLALVNFPWAPSGFAGGGEYDLPGVRVSVATPFVSLLFTPLDNRDLNKSEHILITALARDKQTGTVYNSDGARLIEAGGPPLLLEPVQAEITLKGFAIESVKPVDAYDVPMDRDIEDEQNRFRIDGRYAAYYYEVKRTARDTGPAPFPESQAL